MAKLIASKERRRLSQSTIAYYRLTLQRIFLPWALANDITDAAALTTDQWNAYLEELNRRGLAEPSVQTYLNGVRILLVSLNLSRERMKAFEMPKAKKPMYKILTLAEIDQLEAAATNERDKLIVRVLAETGVRLSELTGLTSEDLLVEVDDPLAKKPERFYFINVWGKGSKERHVPIDGELFARLEAFAAAGGERKYVLPALQHDQQKGKLVMLAGGRLSNNSVDKMFRKLKELAGITKPCTPHKLRHAFITHALTRGMAPMQIANMVGHADLNMITRVYSHLTPIDVAREHRRAFGMASAPEETKKRRRIA